MQNMRNIQQGNQFRAQQGFRALQQALQDQPLNQQIRNNIQNIQHQANYDQNNGIGGRRKFRKSKKSKKCKKSKKTRRRRRY